MTWFISTTDIIWFGFVVIAIWFFGSLATAVRINDGLGLKGDDIVSWLVVLLCLVTYGAPIVFIGMAVLS